MAAGDAFEKEVLQRLKDTLKNKGLPLVERYCDIHHHKKYYSRARRGYITTDVTIEVFLPIIITNTRRERFIPRARRPSIVWVWECKDYKHAVPVSDLEEFHSKLQQIGADLTKGTVISRGPYQKGAIEYATANGIGLARLLHDSPMFHIRFREGGKYQAHDHQPEQFLKIMTSDVPTYDEFYAYDSGGQKSPPTVFEEYVKHEHMVFWGLASAYRAISRWETITRLRRLVGLPPKQLKVRPKQPKA